MHRIDVFNGDADGLCALHQLRLNEPQASTLVTDIKANVRLVERITPPAGSVVTVLDVSLQDNRDAVLRLLHDDCQVIYFDHHIPGQIPEHARLEAHIDPSPSACTSLLVNQHLAGRYCCWAATGAFGDNMGVSAQKVLEPLGLSPGEVEELMALGNLLNYNGYGNQLADLHFHPVDLYRAISPYEHPLAFYRKAPEAETLRKAFAEDMSRAMDEPPVFNEPVGRVFLFNCEPWARRVVGVYANRLANEEPDQATAVGVDNGDGTLRISVRAPLSRPFGVDALCREFAGGGGRSGAGAINRLPMSELPSFLDAFRKAFEAIPERP
jgi:single-stranded DNA-specific DHH superfamily exonuclease